MPYFTAKARVMEYVKSTYPDMTSVFPSPAYFYTNFMQYYKPTCGVAALVFSVPAFTQSPPALQGSTKACQVYPHLLV